MRFRKFLEESNRKPNKIWVDKVIEFYNNCFKIWLKDNDIEMHSIHNEGKSVVAEKFIRTLKTKIYKCLTSVSKDVYIHKLDAIVSKYNNIYHTTTRIKPVDVEYKTYIYFKQEVNDAGIKFKVGNHLRILKYKNIFAKGYTSNWSEEVFVIKKFKNTVSWVYVINDLNEKQLQKNK